MKIRAILFTLALVSTPAFSTYSANLAGEVSGVYTYTEGDYIFFTLKNQPSSHPGCNPAYFSIDGSVPVDRRKIMLARLMAAYATHETVNIGYDKDGTCSEGVIRVYRVG
ncbi:MAG: hypothetical protein EOP38_19640 [Rubrivivax sp.]|nr:MAG: hypothetical protein EOP38_19640 [Rubrivivax sp.]